LDRLCVPLNMYLVFNCVCLLRMISQGISQSVCTPECLPVTGENTKEFVTGSQRANGHTWASRPKSGTGNIGLYVHVYGTIYLRTLPHRRLCEHLKKAVISSVLFRSHLLAEHTANCFLSVVLEVAVRCLGHVKKLHWLILIDFDDDDDDDDNDGHNNNNNNNKPHLSACPPCRGSSQLLHVELAYDSTRPKTTGWPVQWTTNLQCQKFWYKRP